MNRTNMADDIHEYLSDFLEVQGLHRSHDDVLYVQFLLSNNELDNSFVQIYSGKRKAIFRLKDWFQSQNIPLPKVDSIVVLTDYFGEPHSVVRITEIEKVAYKSFTSKMALAAGVEDGDLDIWRDTRRKAIEADCDAIKIAFNEDVEIMAMWFELLYPARL